MKSKHHQACRVLLAAAMLGLAGTSAAHAQFRASLTGTVTDPTGAVVPGAQVTLTDNQTGKTLNAVSNESGFYTFNALAPDTFTLTTKIAGFKTSTIKGLTIIPEQANNTNVQLQLGTADTTVDVNADTLPTLDTASAALNNTVSSNQIQHLPSAGRDIFKLAQLAPGAFGDGNSANLPGTQGPGGGGLFSTENGPQTLSGGGQYETNSVSIDGISTSSAVWGGTTVITPTEDSVESLKITTNAYDAEFGRFSGAQMQVTSKSGTNQVHGSAYIRLNRPGLNAYQRYNGPGSLSPGTPAQRGLTRDTNRFNQIGGSLGGPLWKDKLFAFFAYETVRNNSTSTANGWYETQAFDSLTSSAIASKYNSFAGHRPNAPSLITQTCANIGLSEGVNCRTVAGQGLDIGRPLTAGSGQQDLGWTGASNPGTGGDGTGSAANLDGIADIAYYQTASPTSSVQQQFNGRVDAQVGGRDHITFAIYWVPQSTTSYNGTQRTYNLYHHSQINDAYSGIWNHTFSPSLLNEARFNDAGWRWNEIQTNPQEPFGLPQDQVDTIGNITLSFFGAPGPSVFNQHTYTYRDIVTKVVKNMTIKAGAELTRLYYLNNPTYSARPSYNFYNVWDFLNDAPHTEGGQFNRFTGTPTANRYDNRENLWGAFVQDDWKVLPNLTINMGVRYSYFDSLYAKQDNLPALRFGSGQTLFTGMNITRGGHLWNPQSGNVSPEIGFAYSPAFLKDRVVIRGGYGLNYNQEEIAITGNFANNPSDAVSPYYSSASPSQINSNIVYGVPADSYTLFGYPANPHTVTNYNAAGLPTTTGLSVTGFPTNLKTAYTHHFSLEAQTQLARDYVVSVGYQGALAHHLISQQNLYVYGAYTGAAFNSQVASVDYYGDYAASNYNALLISLRHNMRHHLQLNADYTYSKSMDDGSGPYEEDPYPYNNYYARGRSDFNFGQAFKTYALWQPVFFHGENRFLNKLLGEFSFSGIYNFHTGFPWTPVYNAPTQVYYGQSGYGTLRPAAYIGRAGKNFANDSSTLR